MVRHVKVGSCVCGRDKAVCNFVTDVSKLVTIDTILIAVRQLQAEFGAGSTLLNKGAEDVTISVRRCLDDGFGTDPDTDIALRLRELR
jgi:hypothetical protein